MSLEVIVEKWSSPSSVHIILSVVHLVTNHLFSTRYLEVENFKTYFDYLLTSLKKDVSVLYLKKQ